MKRFMIVVFIASACLMAFHVNASDISLDQSSKIKRIAVREFRCEDKMVGKMLAEWTISVLMDRQDCKVIERILLDKVSEEQALGQTGALDTATVAKIGKVYGASQLLFGTVGKLGQKYFLTVKIIDASSAETVLAKRGDAGNLDSIPELLVSLINQRMEVQENKQPKSVMVQGLWDGYFQYDDSRRGYIRGDFTANFDQPSSTNIKGEITEPWSDGFPKNYSSFHSMIQNGNYNPSNKQISFTKIYDFDGHSVTYVGILVGDDVMTGRWNIGSYTGSWRAVRKK